MVVIKKLKTKNKKLKIKGFTLVELLVAVAIFSLIIGIAISLFVSVLKVQRKSLNTQELLSQVNYVVEYMGRAIRMAKRDLNGSCIPAGLNFERTDRGIRFKNYLGICQEFYLTETRKLSERETRDSAGHYLTGRGLEVLAFNIAFSGWSPDDNYQPRITLFLRVRGKETAEFKIQTTISQRNPDIR